MNVYGYANEQGRDGVGARTSPVLRTSLRSPQTGTREEMRAGQATGDPHTLSDPLRTGQARTGGSPCGHGSGVRALKSSVRHMVPLPCFALLLKSLSFLTGRRYELALFSWYNYTSFTICPCFGGLAVVRCLVCSTSATCAEREGADDGTPGTGLGRAHLLPHHASLPRAPVLSEVQD